MNRLAKAHSKDIANKYLLLGWTLRREIRVTPEEEPYEYVFEWESGGDAPYPEIWGTRIPEHIQFKLSCLELVVVTAAMFVSVEGPVPPRLLDLTSEERATISRLQEQCYALREIAWSRAGTELMSTRDEVIGARLQTSVNVQLGVREVQLVAHVLDVCTEEVDAHGDILAVTGFQEYGASSDDFRALRERFIDAISKCARPAPT